MSQGAVYRPAQEKFEKMAITFDLVLVIMNLMAACIFQFACTTLPLFRSTAAAEEIGALLQFDLRIIFGPSIFATLLWLANRSVFGARLERGFWRREIQIGFSMFSLSILLFAFGSILTMFIDLATTPSLKESRYDYFWNVLQVPIFTGVLYANYTYRSAETSSLERGKTGWRTRINRLPEVIMLTICTYILFLGLLQKLAYL